MPICTPLAGVGGRWLQDGPIEGGKLLREGGWPKLLQRATARSLTPLPRLSFRGQQAVQRCRQSYDIIGRRHQSAHFVLDQLRQRSAIGDYDGQASQHRLHRGNAKGFGAGRIDITIKQS